MKPAPDEALLRRALAAMDVTPLSLAAAEGLDRRTVPGLLAGRGDREAAARLAEAFRRASAELRALAAELSEAAQLG